MGRAWWLKPVIPALWEAEVEDHLSPATQRGEIPSLPKIQKYYPGLVAHACSPRYMEGLSWEGFLEPRRLRLQ